MFRPGRNPKDSTHTTDDTADHTPHTSPSGHGSSTTPAPTPTEAYQQSVHTQTTSLIIENGALFEGSCRMVQLKEQLDKQPGADRGAATASASTSANASSSGIPTPSYKSPSAPSAAAKTAPSGSSADVKEATDLAS